MLFYQAITYIFVSTFTSDYILRNETPPDSKLKTLSPEKIKQKADAEKILSNHVITGDKITSVR